MKCSGTCRNSNGLSAQSEKTRDELESNRTIRFARDFASPATLLRRVTPPHWQHTRRALRVQPTRGAQSSEYEPGLTCDETEHTASDPIQQAAKHGSKG